MRPHPTGTIPTEAELAATLGPAQAIWQQLHASLTQDFPGLRLEWKTAKIPFGRYGMLRQKERTLVYLIPHAGNFEVSVVLGKKAAALALATDLPTETRQLVAKARRYAEGRGIRFPVTSVALIPAIRALVACKVALK